MFPYNLVHILPICIFLHLFFHIQVVEKHLPLGTNNRQNPISYIFLIWKKFLHSSKNRTFKNSAAFQNWVFFGDFSSFESTSTYIIIPFSFIMTGLIFNFQGFHYIIFSSRCAFTIWIYQVIVLHDLEFEIRCISYNTNWVPCTYWDFGTIPNNLHFIFGIFNFKSMKIVVV